MMPFELQQGLSHNRDSLSQAQIDSESTAQASEQVPIARTSPAPHGIGMPRRSSSFSNETCVLFFTRFNEDSRIALLQCTCSWLPNALLGLAALWKDKSLRKTLSALRLRQMLQSELVQRQLVETQIGPPPTHNPGMLLQYNVLQQMCTACHLVDTATDMIDAMALCLVKVLFCTSLQAVWDGYGEWPSFRVMFLPFVVAWAVTAVLALCKDRQQRVFGTSRDLFYLFLVFLAFKLDGQSLYSWKVVFFIPWMWFVMLFLLAFIIVLTSLSQAWVGRPLRQLLVAFGIFLVLASTLPQAVSYMRLTDMLDGNIEVSNAAVLVPNIFSWLCMWLSSLLLAYGLRQNELARAEFLRSGALWRRSTETDAGATQQLRRAAVAETQRRIDAMAEQDIELLVQQLMQGKTKPNQMVRVSQMLYRQLSGSDLHPLKREAAAVQPLHQNLADDVEQQLCSPAPALEDSSMQPLLTAGWHAQYINSASAVLNEQQQPMANGEAAQQSQVMTSQDAGTPAHSAAPQVLERPQQGGSMVAAPTAYAIQLHAEGRHRRSCSLTSASGEQDEACFICCDAAPSSLLLPCGHDGLCRRCANLVFVRPPNECPSCRAKIEQVLKLETMARVGQLVYVEQR